MSKILCTFPGKFGDILWALPTVRAIAQTYGDQKVDFGIMPQYESLVPLIQAQPYVEKAFTIPDWICTGSPHGDQPWHPPVSANQGYDRWFHLGYKGHPGMNGFPRMPLVDFTAHQQGIKFTQNPLPFLTTTEYRLKIPYVAYAFNSDYREQKEKFLVAVKNTIKEFAWRDVSRLDWGEAAIGIKNAIAFVGCRSANYVLAHGVGQKKVLVYEPHPGRSNPGAWADVFSCSKYSQEINVTSPEQAVEYLKSWKAEENEHAIIESSAR